MASMSTFSYLAQCEDDTEQLGQRLASLLPPEAVICLNGTLGAGKTRLVQAIASAIGIDRQNVVSPTFTICHEHPGQPGINHLDLYRVRDEDELFELGFDEYIASPRWTFIEWADRFPHCLPAERLEIEIHLQEPPLREFRIRALGDRFRPVIEQLRKASDNRAHD
jgi:tRNA threonylcarbamoyladenosine biosynthesis protein TsaE